MNTPELRKKSDAMAILDPPPADDGNFTDVARLRGISRRPPGAPPPGPMTAIGDPDGRVYPRCEDYGFDPLTFRVVWIEKRTSIGHWIQNSAGEFVTYATREEAHDALLEYRKEFPDRTLDIDPVLFCDLAFAVRTFDRNMMTKKSAVMISGGKIVGRYSPDPMHPN